MGDDRLRVRAPAAGRSQAPRVAAAPSALGIRRGTPTLSAPDVLALQRKAGNRAVTRLVSTMVQRLAYTDAPSSWGAVTIKRSEEGIAGVYFVRSGADQIVLKPMTAAAPTEYASRFMQQGMGLDAPLSKIYAKNSPEGQQITTLLTTTPVQGARSATEVQDQVKDANYYLVMSTVVGKSIQKLDEAEATEFIQNDAALKAVGRIMVADAFLGNSDRLIGGTVNLGNFFYAAATATAAGVVRTIDVAGRGVYIQMVLTKFRQQRNALGHANAVNALDGRRAQAEAAISQGIDDALNDMAQVFRTNIDLVRAVAVPQEQESRAKRDPSAAKGLAHYIRARVREGVSKQKAVDKLKDYLEYRARRNKTPRGLKWLTRLFSDVGFSFA
jgi:hypothetical protein